MTHERPVPDWELAMYRLGELQPARAEKIRERLAGDPELAARLEALDAREAELKERLPPRVVAARVEEATAPDEHRRNVRRWWLVAELMVAALLLVLILPPLLAPEPATSPAVPGVRDKGVEPYLRIHREVPGGLEELSPGDRVGTGERLQLSYTGLGRPYGVVLSVDGRGAVTLHLPRGGSQAAELAPEGTVDLPESYELDDAPDFERFYLITAQESFAIEAAITAAEALEHGRASLDLPRHLEQAEFTVRKAPSP
jgi:hypothetical protein